MLQRRHLGILVDLIHGLPLHLQREVANNFRQNLSYMKDVGDTRVTPAFDPDRFAEAVLGLAPVKSRKG